MPEGLIIFVRVLVEVVFIADKISHFRHLLWASFRTPLHGDVAIGGDAVEAAIIIVIILLANAKHFKVEYDFFLDFISFEV